MPEPPAGETKIPVISSDSQVSIDGNPLVLTEQELHQEYVGVANIGSVIENESSKNSKDMWVYTENEGVITVTFNDVEPGGTLTVPDNTILVSIDPYEDE